MAGTARFWIKLAGNVMTLLLNFLPIPTFTRIIQNRSTGDELGLRYVSALLNCLLSAWYCHPFVTANNLIPCIVHCVGTLIRSVYVILFIIYAPTDRQRSRILLHLGLCLGLLVNAALVSISLIHGDDRKFLCGCLAAVSSIQTYVHPHLKLWMMEIPREVDEYTRFLASLFVFLCSFSWIACWLLGDDPYFIVPHGIAFGTGALKLLLYAVKWLRATGNGAEGGVPEGVVPVGIV